METDTEAVMALLEDIGRRYSVRFTVRDRKVIRERLLAKRNFDCVFGEKIVMLVENKC
jgi:hypothetical protein